MRHAHCVLAACSMWTMIIPAEIRSISCAGRKVFLRLFILDRAWSGDMAELQHTHTDRAILATDGFMHGERPYRNGFPFVAHVCRLLHSRSIHNKFIFTLDRCRNCLHTLRFVSVWMTHECRASVVTTHHSPVAPPPRHANPKIKWKYSWAKQLRLFQLNLNCLRRFVCQNCTAYLTMLSASTVESRVKNEKFKWKLFRVAGWVWRLVSCEQVDKHKMKIYSLLLFGQSWAHRKWHLRRLIRTFFGYLKLYLFFLVAHWDASAPKINSTCLFKRKRKIYVEMNVFDEALVLHHGRIAASLLGFRVCDMRRGAVKRGNRSTQNTWINHLCSCEKDKPFCICIFCAQLRVARCSKYTTWAYTTARVPKWSGRLSTTSQLMGIRNANGGNSTKISRFTNWHTHTSTLHIHQWLAGISDGEGMKKATGMQSER